MLRRLLSLPTHDRTQRAIILFSLLLLLTLGVSQQFSVVRAATIFTVNSNADPGVGVCDLAECTLREALTEANNTDSIVFNIVGGGAQTINLTAPLDPIAQGIIIDGATQPGGATCDAPLITLDGTNIGSAANGLTIVGGNTTVTGLTITDFQGNGVDISGAPGNNTIQCNTITNNLGNGVSVVSTTGNRITQNKIFSNGGYITLGGGGANNDQDAPALTAADYDATNLTVSGSLSSTVDGIFNLEYFVCDGTAEAGNLLHTNTVTINAGTGTISDSFSATLSSGAEIAVTATDPTGNTSPFSTCFPIIEIPIYDSTPAPNSATPIPIGSAVFNSDSSTRSDTVTISNIGAGSLNVSFVISGGNAPGDFTVDTPASSVIFGTPLIVAVTCTPTALGTRTTTLTVLHNSTRTPISPVTYELECLGTATPVPDYLSDPLPGSTINLGSSLVGIMLDVFNVIRISNLGGATLNINSYNLTNPTEFTVVNPPTSIGVSGADELVEVRCTPSAVGLRTTTLTIDTNDTTQPVGGYEYTLQCTGDPGTPDYSSNPAVGNPINLGPTIINTMFTNANALVISNNAGTGPLTISGINISGGNVAEFTLNTMTLTPIAIGASASISISCTPTATGVRTTTLSLSHDAPAPTSPIDYTVNCTGLQPITVTPATLPDGVVGTAYSENISATGGSGTYTSFVVTAGTAPPGVMLNGITGLFSGTPTTTVGSPFNFTITVTDSLGNSGALPYTVNITATPIVIAPATVPDGTVGTAYVTQTVTTTGGVAPIVLTHSGNVPPGLTFDDATGTLSGIPTTVTGSPFAFTVTATDAVGTIANQPYTIIISPATPIVIAPATVPDGTVGTAYVTQTVTTTGGVAPIVLAHSGNVPPGLTFDDATGTLSGTPSTVTGSPFAFTVIATDAVGTIANQPYTIIISPAAPIVFAPLTVPDGTVGTAYVTQTVTTTGGVAPIILTHSVNVPPGLTFDDATGVLSGIPTTVTGSPFTLTVTATDALGTIANQPYTIIISPAAPIVFAPLTVPDGTVGTAYVTQTVTTTGGVAPIVLTHSGNVPPGLTFDDATGVLSGIPITVTGSPFTFTVTATDALGTIANQPYTIIISPAAPIVIAPATVPDGTVGTAYVTQTVTTTGGVAPIVLTHSGNVPPGLTFNDATGTLSGIPTTVTGSPFAFTVTATDALGTIANQPYTIIISPAAALTITPPTLPNGTVGTIYLPQTVTAAGGVAPIVLTHSGNVPPGLTFDDATGTLSGIPTTVTGSPFAFTITATDALGTIANQPYTIIISPAAALTLTPPTLPNGTVGTIYLPQTVTAAGGVAPIVLTHSGNVPPGLTFDDASGVLSGTPNTVTGSPFTFTVTATDSFGTIVNQPYIITISPPLPLLISPASLPNGTLNVVYVPQTVSASGGVAPITLTHSGNVPTGLTFDDATGVLSGTPTTITGSPFTFTVTATDALGTIVSQPYTITISTAPTIILDPAILTAATRNLSYSRTITASGGTGPYTFSVTVGTLPLGITLTPAGLLSGTPTVAGPYSFTIRAIDSLGNPGTRAYALVVGVGAYASSPIGPGGTINVGTVLIGTAISFDLTTSNTGNAPLIVGQPSITAGDPNMAADFAVSTLIVAPATQPFPYSLNANSTQVITVRCIPSAAGVRQATLTLPVSGDPTRTSAIYILQCTGSGTAVATVTPIGFVPTATAFVPTVTPVLPATGTVGEVKGLAMRTGPYLGATLIGKAIPGVPYSILAQSNDEGGGITWYLITVDTVTGWVSGLYLNVSGNIGIVPFQGSIFDQIDGAPDVGITARAMSIIDIRRRPSGRAAILTQVPQDGIVRLLGRTRQNGGDFWVQINYNGVIGWIPAAPISINGSTGNVPIR